MLSGICPSSPKLAEFLLACQLVKRWKEMFEYFFNALAKFRLEALKDEMWICLTDAATYAAWDVVSQQDVVK